jgi:aldose 1-epimerase
MSSSIIRLTNSRGFSVATTAIGASVTDITLRNGTHVMLGYKDISDYKTNPPYIGCTVGRCTNRTANAKFTINGKEFNISANVPPNHLHGGAKGFNKVIWNVGSQTSTSVTYTMTSPDGDQGYPGNLTVNATYSITDNDELVLEYTATTDAPTPVNLTNHSYFNLAGKGDIKAHVVTINADYYTPVKDHQNIPTGDIASVEGTPLDFRTPHEVGERCMEVSPVGYDNNFCLNSSPAFQDDPSLTFAAKLEDPSSGNKLLVYTNQPCVQFYQGGYLDGTLNGLDGQPLTQFAGLCLETQKHPDAINQPNFPTTLLVPSDKYINKTVWKFESQ